MSKCTVGMQEVDGTESLVEQRVTQFGLQPCLACLHILEQIVFVAVLKDEVCRFKSNKFSTWLVALLRWVYVFILWLFIIVSLKLLFPFLRSGLYTSWNSTSLCISILLDTFATHLTLFLCVQNFLNIHKFGIIGSHKICVRCVIIM